ncbi:MAG: ABC transporter permease [Candidatus Pacebacteria bacterium]|nr:ABC transporter permease [Candidatus Paceibacterota bacterium]
MTLKDTLEETYTALSANKVRSGLTILGIVIGISSVITLVSIGQGATASIQSSIQSLGSNLLLVTPGASKTVGFGVATARGSAQTLTNADANAIASQVQNVAAVAQESQGRYQIAGVGTNTNTSVDGVTSSYASVRNVQVGDGTFITDEQNTELAKVAVLGPTVVSDLIASGTEPVGQTIRINGQQFTVVGVTLSKGASGAGSQDDTIYIPLSTEQLYLAGNQYLTAIDVQAASADTMTQAQNDVTDLLLQRHNISNPSNADFSVLNQADILASASSITGTLTYLLGAIAGISLLVGGIGIMNMMLTTVTERTREIGLRKAIGAKQADISMQFLVEAVTLTLIGGVTGIILGLALSFGVNATGIVHTSVSWSAILLAFGVSAAIGIAFGWYPARRAASLNPIEALRYE